jgi:hypothetical protein
MPRQLGASLQSERGSLPEQRESDMSLKFTAGDLTIHRLIEEETTFLPEHDLFAGLTPDLLAENRQSRFWGDRCRRHADPVLSVLCRSYPGTILIDSCIGNDKPRPQRPKWNQKTDDTYMRALAVPILYQGLMLKMPGNFRLISVPLRFTGVALLSTGGHARHPELGVGALVSSGLRNGNRCIQRDVSDA